MVMGNNPSHFQRLVNSTVAPVEQVSWEDCQEFLSKLNERFPDPQWTFRLPTEAEWEYACRAGSTTRYYFGDDASQLGEYAWYRVNSGGRTQWTFSKKPNAWDLFDMCGNVWQWCQDGYAKDYYRQSPEDDPTGPLNAAFRVCRGGSWRRGRALPLSVAEPRRSPRWQGFHGLPRGEGFNRGRNGPRREAAPRSTAQVRETRETGEAANTRETPKRRVATATWRISRSDSASPRTAASWADSLQRK